MRPASILFAILVLLAGCQPHGPIAELNLGWMRKIADLELLEDLLRQSGFQPEPQQYFSEQQAFESVKSWRRKVDGRIYSIFRSSPDDPTALRAVLALHERTGRLDIRVVGFERDCETRLFVKPDQANIDRLQIAVRERIYKKARFQYAQSQRC